MADIFISYTRADNSRVLEIEELLKKDGYKAWRDTVAMPYAVNWEEAVIEAICRSQFAVIFDSEARREKMKEVDSACAREFDWIRSVNIRYIIIDLDSQENRSPEKVKNDIEQWIREEKNENRDEIEAVTKLVAGGYAFKNDVVSFHKNDIPRSILWKIAKLLDLRAYKMYVDDNPELGTGSLELRPFIYEYLKRYRRRVVTGLYLRVVLLISIALILFFGYRSGKAFFQNMATSNQLIEYTNYISACSRTIDSDPMFGAALLNSNAIKSEFAKSHNLLKVLNGRYPSEYCVSGDAAQHIQKLTKNTGSQIKVTMNSNNGIVSLEDPDGVPLGSFAIDGVPVDYDVSEDEEYVVVCTDSKPYLYCTGNAYSAEPLKGNNEVIDKVYFSGRRVYAVTVNGNLVGWDLSDIQEKQLSYQLQDGRIMTDKDKDLAAFVSDGNLIINTNNTVQSFLLPSELSNGVDYISISHRGNEVALLGKGMDVKYCISVFDRESNAFVNKYVSGNRLGGLDFTMDDSALLFGDWTDCTLSRIELSNGQVEQSKQMDAKVYTIKAYNGGCVIGMTNGSMCSVDDQLSPASICSWDYYGNISKRIAVSENHGVYFTATRNTNNFAGNAKYFLNGDERKIILELQNVGTLAANDVTVSKDGEYVAYGNDNGVITVWDIDGLIPVLINSEIKEGIISLTFTGDKNIVALGKSGTIYNVKLDPQVTECNGSDQEAQFGFLRQQCRDIYDRLWNLGLTDISEEQYTLQEHYSPD